MFNLTLSKDERLLVLTMLESFIECDEDCIKDGNDEEVEEELVLLKNLRQKLNAESETWERDPIFQQADGTWWFWDETWSNEHGPFATEQETQFRLNLYCATQLEDNIILTLPLSLKVGDRVRCLEDRPFVNAWDVVTVSAVDEKSNSFDFEVKPDQHAFVHANDLYCFVKVPQ